MTYMGVCFSCQKPLDLRDSIIVKQSLRKGYLARLHPSCWAKISESVAQANLEYTQTRELMREALG